jgi:putative tricarboxylic transport membrane protein
VHDAVTRSLVLGLWSLVTRGTLGTLGTGTVLQIAVLSVTILGIAPAAAQTPYDHLRLIAPAAPGGGWDQTARVMQQVVQRTGIARTVSVDNVPGAAGLIGLARFVGAERGNGDAVLVSGLIMLGAIVTQRSAVTLDDVTPIARLTGEYEVLTVPAASPFRTLDDFIQALRERPESISWGGGSAGGSDQILAGLIADAVGVAPRRVNYIAFSGGGEALAAVLGGQVSVGINGLAEFAAQIEAGTVRPLAISSAERLPGLDIPTLREQGIDIEFENWRSVVAPPGIGAADRRRLEAAVEVMVRSAGWNEALARYRWIDRYLAGDAFARFVDAEERRVEDILMKFGTREGSTPSLTAAGPYPIIVLSGLALCGLATVLAWRRTPPDADNAARGWRPIGLVGVGILFDLVLAERAGFIIASAVLFWFVARAFDPRHPLRDGVFAATVSAGAYLLFARVLDLQLPGGLAGW